MLETVLAGLILNRSTLIWQLAKQSNNFCHTKEKVSWSVEGNGTWRQKARSTESKIGQSKRPRFVSSSTFESKIYYEKSGIDFGHSNTAGNLPAIVCSLDVTALRLDRKWRSLLVDNNIISDKHEGVRFEDFCQSLTKVDRYRSLARFVLEISSFPQSTAAVERTFSKLNLNKTKSTIDFP